MKALVEESGRVAQIVDDNSTFPVAQPLVWIDCDNNIHVEDSWDGARFVPAPDPIPQGLTIKDIQEILEQSGSVEVKAAVAARLVLRRGG